MNAAFVDTYNEPEHDLVIKWVNDGHPVDGNPIRNADATAKNITIDANFTQGSKIMNKGVYIDGDGNHPVGRVTASGKIDVTAYDDGLFTDGRGAIEVKGFKELTVNSVTGFGVVDNGNGITIEGQKGSTVTINAKSRPVIGDSLYATAPERKSFNFFGHEILISKPVGTLVSITADNINLIAGGSEPAIFAGYGGDSTKYHKFNVDLNAANVNIQGQIKGLNGNVTIGDKTAGTVKLNVKDGDAITASEGSVITIHENGKDSVIKGNITAGKDSKAGEQTKVSIDSKGSNFNLTGDTTSSDNAEINVSLAGANSKFTGNATNNAHTNITLASNANWTGDLTANDGGTATVTLKDTSTWDGKAAGNGDIAINDSARWNVTADSEANSLKFSTESAIASLAGSARKLTLNELNGSGTFLMDLKYQDDDVATYREGTDSDYIIAKTGDGGTHKVSLTDDSDLTGMTNDSKLYFATTGAATSTFKPNENVRVMQKSKITDKNLLVKKDTDTTDAYKGNDNWYLTLKDQEKPVEPVNPDNPPAPGPNDPVNPNGLVPGKAYSSTLALWRENDALHKRLGELRYGEDEEGVWARYYNMKLERDGSHGFHSNYKNLQVGLDKKAVRTNGDWYYGLAVEHLWGKPSYQEGHGEQKLTDVALYGTNVKKDDSFLDYTFKVGRIDSDYDTAYGDHGDFENWAAAIGAEYGKRYALGNNWTIEPQAQLTYNYLWGDDYTTKNGARVSQDNADSLVGRLGFLLARELHPELKTPSRIYVKASLHHDFLGDTTSTIADDVHFTDNDDLGDTWYTVGIGTDLRINDGVQFYFDAEKNFGADVDMKYRFNAGFRFDF